MVYQFFEVGGHRITIRNRDTNFARTMRFFNQKQLNKIIEKQESNEDIYIEKYGKNRLVQVVILDLDSEDDISLAYNDAKRCKNYFERNGNNCVIVESGSKGYHLYIQIAPVCFDREEINPSMWFQEFVNRLLSGLKKPLTTLDEINSSAGLNGNIRLIGSIHPKTGKKCRIIDGEFVEVQPPTDLTFNAVNYSYNDCKNFEISSKKSIKKTTVNGFDPVACNDLRDVFRDLGCDVKIYDSGYGYTQCLWHGDSHPSLLITENWFSCSACGKKGNIWTLMKEGYVKFEDDGNVVI